jgi:predicted flap endonuclease-1-like 5' DNA nuclease
MAKKVTESSSTLEARAPDAEFGMEEHEPEMAAGEEEALEYHDEPGPVKHITFPEEPGAGISGTPTAMPTSWAAAPSMPAPAPATDFGSWRRTVYRTDAGGEVRSYESPTGARTLTLSTVEAGREMERPFSETDVDSVIGGVETMRRTTTTTVTTETTEMKSDGKAKGKRNWLRFGRRKEDSGKDYNAAQVVSELPAEPVATPAPMPPDMPATSAWEPPSTMTTTTVTRTLATPAPAKGSDRFDGYKGDVHPVIDIEGIGPEYAARLAEAGVHSTARLLYEDAGRLAKQIGVAEKSVRLWQSMAELMAVKGIGPQSAEVLARAGVDGIGDLKRRNPDRLYEELNKLSAKVDVAIIGQPITLARVKSFQKAAKGMKKVRLPVPEN